MWFTRRLKDRLRNAGHALVAQAEDGFDDPDDDGAFDPDNPEHDWEDDDEFDPAGGDLNPLEDDDSDDPDDDDWEDDDWNDDDGDDGSPHDPRSEDGNFWNHDNDDGLDR